MKSQIKNKKNRTNIKHFHGGHGEKKQGEIILNGWTIDQIMQRWGMNFINDKCIFQ